jgi:glycosyltransferase involved in cell wall biosynthesis
MISILLATYNGEKYIKNSIDSIINQTFTDWELLIGFNGTNDLSIDIVNQYNDNRIKIFNYGDEKGKAKTLNKLLLETSRNWIALQDDDDIWLETKLEKQLRFIKDYDLIGTKISYIDEHGNYIGCPNLSTNHEDIIRLSLAGDNQIANTSAIFKKADAIKISGWDTTIDGIEDFDFWLRLIRLGKITINIPEKLVLHRLHDKSNFNTKNYELNKILNK